MVKNLRQFILENDYKRIGFTEENNCYLLKK